MALVGSYIMEEQKEALDQKQFAYYEETIRKPVFIIPLPEEETDITFHEA